LHQNERRTEVERWRAEYVATRLSSDSVRPAGFFELDAGPDIAPVYTELDLEPDRPLELPGQFPFTRGIAPGYPRYGPPLIKLYTGLGTPEDTNSRLRKLKEWGAEIIQLATDLPSQIGYDCDHVMAAGEVGRAGVAVSSLRDMEVMFEEIPLDGFVRVGMLGNCIGPIALGLFVALGQKQGLSLDRYTVDLQNDPLKEYVARGTQFLPIRPALGLAADVVEWCSDFAPHWWPLDACVNHLNSAGAGSTAATAFALSNAATSRRFGEEESTSTDLRPRCSFSPTSATISSRRSPTSEQLAGSGPG
jgi:methylmalonyl-CoA mutase N-terminal domain/subunit